MSCFAMLFPAILTVDTTNNLKRKDGMSGSKRITIVGGKGQMGQLFSRLFQDLSHHVQVLDKEDWPEAKTLLSDTDLVLVTVPIHETEATIRKLGPFLNPQAVLADLTSIQAQPLKVMLEVHCGPVIGLHPMFGPTINSIRNQGIIYSEGRDPKSCQWLVDDLQKLGFTLQAMSADKHDHMMNFVQGLEHFNTIALGLFLREQKIDIEELNTLASPVYRIKLLLLGRIFDQDPGLYADIVMADQSRIELIEAYIETAHKLLNELKQGKRQKAIDEFNKAADWLGEFTKIGQDESDVLLNQYYKAN